MQITFREEWIDRRLAYDRFFDNESDYPKYLTVPHVKTNLWIPDSFFPVPISYRLIAKVSLCRPKSPHIGT